MTNLESTRPSHIEEAAHNSTETVDQKTQDYLKDKSSDLVDKFHSNIISSAIGTAIGLPIALTLQAFVERQLIMGPNFFSDPKVLTAGIVGAGFYSIYSETKKDMKEIAKANPTNQNGQFKG